VSTTTAANTGYEVTFEILNPTVEQSTPTLSLEAVIEAGCPPPAFSLSCRIARHHVCRTPPSVSSIASAGSAVSPDRHVLDPGAGAVDCPIASSAMTVPGTALIGVAGGLDPLKIVIPTFTALSIQQSTPLAAVYNTITVPTSLNPFIVDPGLRRMGSRGQLHSLRSLPQLVLKNCWNTVRVFFQLLVFDFHPKPEIQNPKPEKLPVDNHDGRGSGGEQPRQHFGHHG